MLVDVFAALDDWVTDANLRARSEGVLSYPASEMRVLGQTALLEAAVDLNLAATRDVDLYTNCEPSVRDQLARLLLARGMVLDPHGHEVWMPKETQYDVVYEGRNVTAWRAQPDFVLLSKALKAPAKNAALITEYLARGASPLFFQLARRYALDLEQFV